MSSSAVWRHSYNASDGAVLVPGIDLNHPPVEVWLVGRSGSGKSTLLHIPLQGLIQP